MIAFRKDYKVIRKKSYTFTLFGRFRAPKTKKNEKLPFLKNKIDFSVQDI